MAIVSKASPKNSTNDRLLKISSLPVRILGALAPRWAEALAAHLFFRPAPVRSPITPVVPGLQAERMDLPGMPGNVAAWSWGQGPLVLLAHGWNGNAAQMTGFVGPLVWAGYRVVSYDQPAHNHSAGKSVTLVDMIATIRLIASHLGPMEAVIGHSLGGTAAALASGEHPIARRLVLLGSPAFVQYFVQAFVRMLGLSPQRADGVLRHVERRARRDLNTLDLRQLGPRMRIPLLILHDVKDREVPFAHGAEIAAAWPGAELWRFEKVGHTRMLSHPDAIRHAVEFASGDPDRLSLSA